DLVGLARRAHRGVGLARGGDRRRDCPAAKGNPAMTRAWRVAVLGTTVALLAAIAVGYTLRAAARDDHTASPGPVSPAPGHRQVVYRNTAWGAGAQLASRPLDGS